MAFRINTNVSALIALNHLSRTSDAIAKSMQRLSTGLRINSAADDPAGLAISERMRGQIRGLAQGTRNAGDAISMVRTAESSLGQVHAMLHRVRELAVQHGNGSLSTTDRASIQFEVGQLAAEIERLGSSSKFNGIGLLNADTTVSFQVGANDGEVIAVSLISLGATISAAGAVFNLGDANDLAEIDAAINAVSSARSRFGAVENRLGYAIEANTSYHENLVAAESRIRDVDVAAEMVNLSRLQILQQVGLAMLAQANAAPQAVLALLR